MIGWLHWVFVDFAQAFSSCAERELLVVAVCVLFIAVVSPIAEHWRPWLEHVRSVVGGSVVVAHGLGCSAGPNL